MKGRIEGIGKGEDDSAQFKPSNMGTGAERGQLERQLGKGL